MCTHESNLPIRNFWIANKLLSIVFKFPKSIGFIGTLIFSVDDAGTSKEFGEWSSLRLRIFLVSSSFSSLVQSELELCREGTLHQVYNDDLKMVLSVFPNPGKIVNNRYTEVFQLFFRTEA